MDLGPVLCGEDQTFVSEKWATEYFVFWVFPFFCTTDLDKFFNIFQVNHKMHANNAAFIKIEIYSNCYVLTFQNAAYRR